MTQEDTELEIQLDAFDGSERCRVLEALVANRTAWADGTINHNMHMHSFFSYNAEGWSPSRNAWEARKRGLYAAGLCDFDVLDGVEEFLDAGLMLGLRTAAHIETRVFFDAYADKEISSPGEPGVTYIMGAGYTGPCSGDEATTLDAFREGARNRNVDLIQRINPHLGDAAIDYDRDVLPLTPRGNATERHIISAYVRRAHDQFSSAEHLARFWADILETDPVDAAALLADLPALEEAVRARLAKRGGLGYEQPSRETFPPVEMFVEWVLACEAIPMVTWLDGTADGEQDGAALLEDLRHIGCAALNIVPDRNWNIRDVDARAVKTANLRDIVQAAVDMDLPINIGTEMNKLGLPFVDDLDGAALRPYRDIFLSGARIMVGHSLLNRYAGFAYTGEAAATEFPEIAARNAFFEQVGALPPLTLEGADALRALGPSGAYARLRDAVDAV